MSKNERIQDEQFRKKIPLWKWILIPVLVIAMPLFFSLYRSYQLQQVLGPTDPTASQSPESAAQQQSQPKS